MILFKDRRGSGAEIMLEGVPLNPARLATPDLTIGDLHKLAVGDDLAKRAAENREALWDPRVPHDLRNRIIDVAERARQMPESAPGGRRFHKSRNEIATEIVNRVDLPAKLQRRLLKLVLDQGPISSGNRAW